MRSSSTWYSKGLGTPDCIGHNVAFPRVLTYMSTALRLFDLEKDPPRALVRYEPRLKGRQTYVRKLSVESDVFDWLNEPTSVQETIQLKQAVLAHFRQFVLGEVVDDCDYMKRVEDRRVLRDQKFTHEVWSMRPRFHPEHRFFGFFALPDWFVVLNKQTRKKLDEDGEWHRQLDKATRIWAAMLPGRFPHSGHAFNNLVTSNWEHCDARWYPV